MAWHASFSLKGKGFLPLVPAFFLILSYSPATAQDTNQDQIPDDTCILELDLPTGSTALVDGRDYGQKRRLTYKGLQPGKTYRSTVQARFSDGSQEERDILIQAGKVVRLTLKGPAKGKPELVLQAGHAGGLQCAAVSPDGRYLLTGSDDHTAMLFDAATGRKVQAFEGHTDRIACVAYSPDGRQVLTGSYDDTAILWDVPTGRKLRILRGHRRSVAAVDFSPDGRQIVTGSHDDTAVLWDARTGAKLRTFAGHSDYVASVAFSSDGRRVLTGGQDHKAILWDASTGRSLRTFQIEKLYVRVVGFSPDGTKVIVGGGDYETPELYLWDAATGKKLKSLAGHTSEVVSLAFSADGRQFASCSGEETILWDVATWEQIHLLPTRITAVTFDPQNRSSLVTVGRKVTWWNTDTGSRQREYELTGNVNLRISALAFSRDGRRVMTGGDYHIVIWDAAAGQVLRTFRGMGRDAGAAMDFEGRRLAVIERSNAPVLRDVTTGEKLHTLDGQPQAASPLAFSPDGKSVFTASVDKTGILWDAETGQVLRTFALPGRPNSVAFSPNGKRLLTREQESTITLWDVATGNRLQTFRAKTGWVRQVAFSPDGRHVLTGSDEKTAVLRDADTGKVAHTFPLSDAAYCVAFSPDGRRLVLGTKAEAVLWDAVTGRQLRTFGRHGGEVTAVAFSPDGQQVLTGGSDGIARLWDVATGQELAWLMSFNPSGIGQQPEWLVATPEGLFDGSAGGRQRVTFRIGGGLTVVPVDRFFQDFYRPGLLAESLADKSPMPNVQIGHSMPPLVRIVLPAAGGETTADRVTVEVEVSDQGGGINGPWLLQNGTRVILSGKASRQGEIVRRTFEVPLIEGENRLEFFASSADGSWESEPATMTFHYGQPLPKPELYLVAVGVSRYAEESMRLEFATADIQAMAELFRQRGPALYKQVHVATLLDEQATKPAILQSIHDVAAKVRPQDTLVVFLAGHGTMVGRDYYFLPGEFRRQAVSFEDDAKAQGLLAGELGEALTRVPALRRMAIFDTGQSGGPLATGRTARSPFAFRGAIERLARAHGAFTIAAAAVSPEAKEVPELRHGVLTYTLLAGLQAVADGPLKDRWIQTSDGQRVPHVLQWYGFASSHVPRLTEQFFGHAQQIQHSSMGASFPVLPLPATERRPQPDEPQIVAVPPDAERSPQGRPATPTESPSSQKPDLYAVAVGISQYADRTLNLKYARADARAMIELFRQRGAGRFGQVHGAELLDAKATKAGIIETLNSTLQRARPEDTLVVFLSGHGMTVGQRYYFIPHEFHGRSDSFEEDVRRQALAADVLADALAKVPARKRVLVLDTCASGAALGLGRQGRGAFDFRGAIDKLGNQQGVFTVAAASAGEEAQEIEQLGHGALSYTLLAGLRAVAFGPLKDQGIEPNDPDGVASVLEWFSFAATHVPKLTERYLGQSQQIETSGQGTAFLFLPASGPKLPPIGPPASTDSQVIASDTGIVELELPEGTTVAVGDRDYGTQRKLRFGLLESGKSQTHTLRLRFPNGAEEDHQVDVEAGRTVRLMLRGPKTDGPELLLPLSNYHEARSVAFSSDGRWVLTGPSRPVLWDAATGMPLRQFSFGPGIYTELADLSPDGRTVLTAGYLRELKTGCLVLFDTVTARKLQTLECPSMVRCVAFGPDGRKVLCGLQNEKTLLWDVETGQIVRTFWGHSMPVQGVAFSPDGKLAATGSQDGTAIVWDASTGKRVRTFREGRVGNVTSVAFRPDGEQLLVANQFAKTATLWDIASGRKQRTFQGHNAHLESVAFSPDGTCVLTGGGGYMPQPGEVFLWEAATGKKLRSLEGFTKGVHDVTFSPNGKSILTGSGDGTAILWDAATGRQVRVFRGRADGLHCKPTPDGRKLIGCGGNSRAGTGQLVLWDLDMGAMVKRFEGVTRPLGNMALSPDGQHVAAASSASGMKDEKAEVAIWDIHTGRKLRTLDAPLRSVDCVTYSPEGGRLLVAGDAVGTRFQRPDGRILLYDLATGKPLHDILGEFTWVASGAFGPDGRQFVTGSRAMGGEGGGVFLWDSATGEKLRTFQKPPESPQSIAFSPDGRLVLIAGANRRENSWRMVVGFWDPATGKKLPLIPQEESSWAWGLFSPDGRYIVSVSFGDSFLRKPMVLWDTATGKRLRSFEGDGFPSSFTPDGRWLIGSSGIGPVAIWDVATGKQLVQLLTLDCGTEWLAVTPDGHFDGSPEGCRALAFRIGDGLDVVPIERFKDQYHRPGLLKEIFRDK